MHVAGETVSSDNYKITSKSGGSKFETSTSDKGQKEIITQFCNSILKSEIGMSNSELIDSLNIALHVEAGLRAGAN